MIHPLLIFDDSNKPAMDYPAPKWCWSPIATLSKMDMHFCPFNLCNFFQKGLAKNSEDTSLKLTRFLSDGAVLEHKKPIRIRGYGAPGDRITVDFDHATGCMEVRRDGGFELELPVHEAGGPYELRVSDDKGNSLVARISW